MMRRNRAPAVALTDEQRRQIDGVVLAYLRKGEARAGDIVEDVHVRRFLFTLPAAKADYRYVGDALQRLRQADRIGFRGGKWRTTSPTS